MFPEQTIAGRSEASTPDRIVQAARDYEVEDSPQWMTLSRKFPGVSFFATDTDPRSFEYDETRDVWVGRADLLLKAPTELRPGQEKQQVSFTLPVRVELAEKDGKFSVKAFDFCSYDENELA